MTPRFGTVPKWLFASRACVALTSLIYKSLPEGNEAPRRWRNTSLSHGLAAGCPPEVN